jgi:hypothetical protein
MVTRQFWAALALIPALAAGCAQIIGADFDKPFEEGPSAKGSSSAGGGTGGGGGTTAASSSAGPVADPWDGVPLCAYKKTESFEPAADTLIIPGVCGTICYGTSALINLGVGHGLLQFQLSNEAFAALSSGPAPSMTLTTTMSPICDKTPCPMAPGNLTVSPLRNDWVEGKCVNGIADGAMWCQRSPGKPWGSNGADGPVDHGDTAVFLLAGNEPVLVIPLDASKFQGTWLNSATKTLSVLLAGDGVFKATLASREHMSLARPRLDITYCSSVP